MPSSPHGEGDLGAVLGALLGLIVGVFVGALLGLDVCTSLGAFVILIDNEYDRDSSTGKTSSKSRRYFLVASPR